MSDFFADLHIHSRFSRATSKKLTLSLLAAWARVKGIAVLGTGDCTHPAWRAEMAEQLVFDEATGLYRLKRPASVSEALPALRTPHAAPEDDDGVRFMVQGEISSIYKRGGVTRKVHNLVFMPDLETANAFCTRLEALGNIASDGRPILGLDSRNLLEMVLEAHPRAFLVPAHIWTPWFSLFGSKSGFDSIKDCFADLTPHIFALETGLSSDPPMNRLLSALDGYRLISNSDAHSGENLAREVNCFSGEISYNGILEALKEPVLPPAAGAAPETRLNTRFEGTLEFYPEEGKYHADGHRACNVCLSPAETRANRGLCPACGKPLTVGVQYRVMELADRETPVFADGRVFHHAVPLAEILAEVLGVGSKSRKVAAMYGEAVARFGSELAIVHTVPEGGLAQFFPPLGEAVGRMRRGEVYVQSGYDGEFGVIRMFTEQEQAEILRGAGIKKTAGAMGQVQGLSLPGCEIPGKPAKKQRKKRQPLPDNPLLAEAMARSSGMAEADMAEADAVGADSPAASGQDNQAASLIRPEAGDILNDRQQQAIGAGPGPVLVLAGPGTGKTRTLVARIERLLREGVSTRAILAVTFTRKAATELDKRLTATLGEGRRLPKTDTLHALALDVWLKTNGDLPVLLSEESAFQVFSEANAGAVADRAHAGDSPAGEGVQPMAVNSPTFLRDAWQSLGRLRESLAPLPDSLRLMLENYTAHKTAWNHADYTDLLEFWLEQTQGGTFRSVFEHVLVDEVQDLSLLQLTLIKGLLPLDGRGFFGIGDPLQSIYGFRGASGQCVEFFQRHWAKIQGITLEQNYRSMATILRVSAALFSSGPLPDAAPDAPPPTVATPPRLAPTRQGEGYVHLFEAITDETECRWVTDRIVSLIGGTSHTLMDVTGSNRDMPVPEGGYAPGDIAVLVRTHGLGQAFRKSLARVGIPVSEPQRDAFWSDPRVALLLRMAGRMLGIAVALPGEQEGEIPSCPDKVLARGPLGMAAYLTTSPPFDALFWHSRPFRELLRRYDATRSWAALITWIHLQNELELVRQKAEKVQIMSLHAAKGLEFPVVFMPCLEDGIIPYAGALLTGRAVRGSTLDVEEERRLAYVGFTRAKDALFLSFAQKRSLFGATLRLGGSRFLRGLPEEALHRSALVARSQRSEQQLNLW